MSRKKTQPKKNIVPDPKFKSTIIPKLINNIMYDGKRGIAAKIVYDAIDKIKTTECSCRLWPSPGIYAVTSNPLDNLTLATFLKAEFGFLGVVV